MNFWKTLLGSVMVLAAFTACSDDDTETGGYKGIPEITVDGGTSTTIAGALEGGKLEQTVEVVAKGDWEITFANESDATWCTPSPMNGTSGTTQVSFTLGQATAERQATLTLTAVGFVEGIPVTKKASIIVKQNAGGTTAITTNVKAVRDQLTFEQTGKEITESLVLTGIVVSDYVGNNINNHQIMVTDNTTEPGAGLMIRFKGYVGDSGTDYNLTRGSIVSLDLKGGTAQSWYGTYQVQFSTSDPEVKILDANDNTPEAIEVSDPSKLIDYQSQYVKVYSQPVESIRGEKYYNVSSGYANQTFQTKDGSTFLLSFNSYSKDWASTIEIPAKAGYVKGCVSLNNNAGNISPRNADDLAGMTEELFTVETPEPEKTTIAQITAAGQYEIEAATVVATYTGGFVMSDETASILVFLGYGAENIPAVGDVVSVSGSVTSYGDALQFAEGSSVTKTGTATVEYPNPTEITESNIGGLMEKPVVTYVKMTGTLSVSGNYYNIKFTFDSNYTGSISGPNADLNAGSYDDQMITVEGYFVNNGSKNGGGRYFTVVATKITPDTSNPIVTFTTQPTTFAASNPEPQTITYTVTNVEASAVEFAIEGTNADKFTIVSNDDKSVVVKANGDNTTSAAYTATLVAKVNGKTLASVDLKQNGAGGSTAKGFESMAQFISDGSTTSNPGSLGDETTANGETASGFKLGTGSKSGAFESAAVGVTGDKTLGFYAVAWKGKKATLYIKVNNGGTINGTSTFELNANDGASGNAPFTLQELGDNDYYTVSISGLTAESTISFSTSENFTVVDGTSNGRAIVCGVQLF
ncbi:DUF5689 domain-containing protein [uncultured Alistipes sp.]|uniref:DUF5689 domain-containing protein n=1 Tax=uncultured Alistipes sp. TaxID=538949 RepID=UPI0026364493|nr:DUF5689 domain-containing protein [uncultured Alistipes sp.]